MRAYRADEVKTNEDIDDKIIRLIRECDLCIADLTCARPSVYYEAGWVEGLGKPVIYVARGDHLVPSADDLHGNRRVHFDLQMKDIVPWSPRSRTFSTFRRELEPRINAVTRSILRTKQVDLHRLQEEREYERKPPKARLQQCTEMCIAALRKRRYTIDPLPIGWHVPGTLCYRPVNGGYWIVAVFASVNYVKKELTSYSYIDAREDVTERLPRSGLHHVDIIGCDVICFSTRQVPKHRINDALPAFALDEDTGIFYGPAAFGSTSGNRLPVVVHFVYPKSNSDLEEKLKQHLGKIEITNKGASL